MMSGGNNNNNNSPPTSQSPFPYSDHECKTPDQFSTGLDDWHNPNAEKKPCPPTPLRTGQNNAIIRTPIRTGMSGEGRAWSPFYTDEHLPVLSALHSPVMPAVRVKNSILNPFIVHQENSDHKTSKSSFDDDESISLQKICAPDGEKLQRHFEGYENIIKQTENYRLCLCRHILSSHMYVIKIGSIDQDKNKELIHEMFVHASLQNSHPNIVRFHDAWLERGSEGCELMLQFEQSYINHTLDSLQESLTLFQSLHLLQNISQGLLHLHQQNIVHSGIYLSTISFDKLNTTAPSQLPRFRICDLSCCRLISTISSSSSSSSSSLSSPSSPFPMHSPFCAPELKNSSSSRPSFASDVYSLGVLIFRMLWPNKFPESLSADWKTAKEYENPVPEYLFLFLKCLISQSETDRPTTFDIVTAMDEIWVLYSRDINRDT